MASETDFLLALENVSVSFDGFKAVDALNLYINKDELRVTDSSQEGKSPGCQEGTW